MLPDSPDPESVVDSGEPEEPEEPEELTEAAVEDEGGESE